MEKRRLKGIHLLSYGPNRIRMQILYLQLESRKGREPVRPFGQEIIAPCAWHSTTRAAYMLFSFFQEKQLCGDSLGKTQYSQVHDGRMLVKLYKNAPSSGNGDVCARRFPNNIQKIAVHLQIIAQFRVECGTEHMVLPCGDDFAIDN